MLEFILDMVLSMFLSGHSKAAKIVVGLSCLLVIAGLYLVYASYSS